MTTEAICNRCNSKRNLHSCKWCSKTFCKDCGNRLTVGWSLGSRVWRCTCGYEAPNWSKVTK